MEETKTFDEEYVKDLRQEAAKYRTKLREQEEEVERLKGEQESKQNKLLDKEISFAAKEVGAVDPQTVASLVDRNSVEKDEEGNFTNVTELVKGLVEEKPFLKGGDVGRASNPSKETQRVFSKDQLKSMSKDDINANWEDIQEQMSKGLIR